DGAGDVAITVDVGKSDVFIEQLVVEVPVETTRVAQRIYDAPEASRQIEAILPGLAARVFELGPLQVDLGHASVDPFVRPVASAGIAIGIRDGVGGAFGVR